MMRAAFALALLLAACPSRRAPPAADASVTAAAPAIVVKVNGQTSMTLAVRGAGEWSFTPAGQSARKVTVGEGGVKVTDATGEVLAYLRGDELFNADDQRVAQVRPGRGRVTIVLEAADSASLELDGSAARLDGERIVIGEATVEGTTDRVAAAVLTLPQLRPDERAAVFAALQP